MTRFINWTAADLEKSDDWIFVLEPEVVDEIIEQSQRLAHLSTDLLSIDQSKFKLSENASNAFRQAIEKSQKDYSLALIRGFPADRLNEQEFRVACWGVGLYMGLVRPQNVAGDLITDVRNANTGKYRVVNGRGYNTNSELDFHIDSGDVVLLFCRREAKSGGQSLVANPFTVAQHLLEEDPRNEVFLKHQYPFSLGGFKVDSKEHYMSPLLEDEPGRSAFRINIKNIINGSIQSGITVPQEYMDFLYKFQNLAGSAPFCYRMYLKQGDIQILSNFRTIHSRTAFEDYEEPDMKRHLIRLWLCLSNSQPLPESWRTPYANIEPGALRGGYRVEVDPRYHDFAKKQCQALGIRV